MFPIIEAATLGPGVKQFVIDARRIARKQRPGQFVIIRVNSSASKPRVTSSKLRARTAGGHSGIAAASSSALCSG
jgi:NAD(P)H-flavin reductase